MAIHLIRQHNLSMFIDSKCTSFWLKVSQIVVFSSVSLRVGLRVLDVRSSSKVSERQNHIDIDILKVISVTDKTLRSSSTLHC